MSQATEMSLAELLDRPEVGPAMMIQAHPDDEVIGLGGQFPKMHGAVFVHTTDGTPADGADALANGFRTTQEYGRARRRELLTAISLAGLRNARLLEIGCPDQRASFEMSELANELVRLIQRHRPEILFSHPYEGGHPDHDATCFAVHAACRMLAREGDVPLLFEMSSYHNGPQGLTPCCFIPPNSGDEIADELLITLSSEQQQMKRRMFKAFVTQQDTLQYFPIERECVRRAPRYRFGSPPHEGRLFYEMYDWGMTGERFTRLAEEARLTLGLEEVF